MRLSTKPKEEQAEIVGPAVITPLHVRDRDTSVVAGAPKAWRKWTPIEAAFEHGKLAGGDGKHDALARLDAGKYYTTLWDTAQSSGKDSTQALNMSRGGGSGLPLSQHQHDAIKALVAIESHLGQRDRIIVRKVCGEGCFPSEAVALVSADYSKATSPRFREALDALIEAIEAARKNPTRFNVSRVTP